MDTTVRTTSILEVGLGDAGHWALRPVGAFTTDREYVGDTLVLRTVFRSESGVVSVTDALGLEQGARGHDIGPRSPHVLLRRVEGVTGSVAMRSELAPRMEYGRTEPNLHLTERGGVARGGPATLATINCPCHGSKFKVADGSVAGGPATRPLPGRNVKVSGNAITLA